MNHKSTILFLFFLITVLWAQGQINFMKSYGGSSTEYGFDVAIRKQGGYFVCGETLTPAFTFYSCENYFVTANDSGTLQNSFSTGGNTGCDYFTCMRSLPDSGFIVAGNTLSYGLVEYDIQVIRFDKNNTITWSKRLGSINYDQAYGIALTDDGGFVVAGLYSVTSSNSNYYVAKLDANGNLIWTCIFGTAAFERLNSIERTSDNGFIVCGTGGGPPAVAVAKISSTGILQWNTLLQGTTTDNAAHAIQTADGNYAVTGYSYSYSVGSADILLCKLNSTGGLMWYKTFGNSVYNDGVDLTETADSGIVIAGNSHNGFFTNDNVVIMKTDKNGNLIYEYEYGDPSRLESATAMDVADDGGFIIAGNVFGCPSTNYELLFLKTLPNGQCPSCDSNVVIFSTTFGSPTVISSGTASSVGGTVNNIAPLFKYDASNMTLCSEPITILPIELISFYGTTTETQTKLYWSTLSEHNNNYFNVQRSPSATNFETIGTVKGAGNSIQTIAYSFTDTKPLSGINYYRLAQTDYNGETSFSKTVALENPAVNRSGLIVSPNPAADFINVIYETGNTIYEIKILNTVGEILVQTKTHTQNRMDVSSIENGIYFVLVKTDNGKVFNQKLVILR